MKKKCMLLLIFVLVIMMVSCSRNNESNIFEDVDSVISSSAIITKSSSIRKVKLDKDETNKLIKRLKKYQYKYISNANVKGYDYYFDIEYKNKDGKSNTMNISIMKEKVIIDGKLYEVVGHNKKDFQYVD